MVDADPTLYEYEYAVHGGTLHATLARTVHFTGHRIRFAEELVYLGNGAYWVPDAVYGSIWYVDPHGDVHPGIVPKTFDPADAIPEFVYCPTMPQITVGGLPFLFTGSTIPGVAGIAVRDGTVYAYSSYSAALYSFPLRVLFDAQQPWQRASALHLVAAKPAGVVVEEILEMQFNPFDADDRFLYAADALQLRLIRIDSRTGARSVVADDPAIFDFPSSLAFLPPTSARSTSLLVLSNQQHRNPLTNDAIHEDVTAYPYEIAEVKLPRCDRGDDVDFSQPGSAIAESPTRSWAFESQR